jgi:hypothetical protein
MYELLTLRTIYLLYILHYEHKLPKKGGNKKIQKPECERKKELAPKELSV